MKRGTIDGYLDCIIEHNPIYGELDDLEKDISLKENELKFYFVLNKYTYIDFNRETKKETVVFDSNFYKREYDLTYKREDEIKIFKKHSIRLLSLHYLILNEMLPFVAIGFTHDSRFSLPAVNLDINNNFLIYDIKEKWSILNNDLDKLEAYMSTDSSIQKGLVWYTFGKLSNSNIDSFMNYYRCLEEFSRNYYEGRVTKLKTLVEKEFSGFDDTTKDYLTRVDKKNFLFHYLKHYKIDNGMIDKINQWRNKKLAHGNDYEIEYGDSLVSVLEEIEQLAYDIICKNIKELNIPGLKSPQFLLNYTLVFNISKRKIALADVTDAFYLFKELKKMQPSLGVNNFVEIGRISKDELCEKALSDEFGENHILIDENLYKKLIANFGNFIDHNFETHF